MDGDGYPGEVNQETGAGRIAGAFFPLAETFARV
jgi:hypothetical protein